MYLDNSIHEIVLTNIKRLRVQKGWRKSDLAKHTDIDASHISNIENGKKHLGLELLSRIAKALEVEPYEMLRAHDPEKLGMRDKLGMIEQLHPMKQQAIEQMINAFIHEQQIKD